MDARERLETAIAERIVILDGAWGVLLQGSGLEESDFRGERFQDHDRDVKGDPDLLNLSRPDIVTSVHDAYFEAGADITTTNTFTATSIGQADYGLQDAVRDMNLEGARLARESADRHGGLVAGSLGPLNVTLSLSPKVDDPSFRTVDFDQVYAAYAEQIEALRDGGVDLLLIETIFDTLNAKAAIAAAIDVAPDLPRWISVTIVDRSGRTLSGQTIEAFWPSIAHADPVIVGVNCSLGAREMRPSVEALARVATVPVASYPNAGLPNAFGGFDETPEITSALLGEFAAAGLVNLVGGCCGTTPDHIRAIAGGRADAAPRTLPARILHLLLGARALPDHARDRVRDGRRADEHHRLEAVRPLDRVRRLPGGGGRRARPGGERRQPDRREHGHRPDRWRAGHDPVPQPRRDRAGDREGAHHDRLVQVGRRSRPA